MSIWERWKMRRALQDVSDRLSRLEVRVAVTNRAVAQIAAQSVTEPVSYNLTVSGEVIPGSRLHALVTDDSLRAAAVGKNRGI